MSPDPREAAVPTRRTRPAWLVALVTLLALVPGLLGLGTAPAAADDESAAITITSINPIVVSDSGELTITGSLTNTGSAPITGASLRLWSTRGPITNGDAFYNTLDGDQDVTNTLPVRNDDASTQVTGLAAGASRPYALKAPFNGPESLGLASPSSAYLVGVMLVDADGTLITFTSAVIGYPGRDGYRATTVAELSSAPSLVPATTDGKQKKAVFTDDHLAEEIAEGGRLALIAELAESSDVNALIDPLLWDELTAMSAGYQVRTGPGSTTDGTGQAAAAAFLERLKRIAGNGRSYRTLYGSLDVTAAMAAGRGELVDSAATAPAGTPLSELGLAVVTDGSSTSQAMVEALERVSPQIVLSADLDPDGELYQVDGLTMLATHATIATGIPGAATNSDAQRAARLQAEQLVYSLSDSPAVDVVTTTDAARAELASASGRTRLTVKELVASQQPVAVQPRDSLPSASGDRGSAEHDVRGDIGVYEELTGRSTGIDDEALVLAAWSSAFPSDDEATAYIQQALSPITSALASGEVSVHISERLVIPADDSSLPVSVTNTMDIPVRVRIHFESDNPGRISIADTEELEIGAGDSVTVRITPTATGNGNVQMRAVVMTTGERSTELGPRSEFVVTANSSGRVAWVIIIASGIVLMAATALRVRQVRRERTPKPREDAAGGET
ncbi:DUF6049 family protein [Propionibacterium australiense]|uniref:DUF6049 family protein n=1 Tax=Propionibacterium australiense TaxID=119981 RepID=UPI000F83CA24|nr:DUF6049 family protein [Propionibacterium australiense]